MGLFDLMKRAATLGAATTASPMPPQDVASPFAAGQLQSIVWSDIFGQSTEIMTREEALAIPGVHKARAVLLALIADKPLVAYKGEERMPTQPTWTRRTSGAVSPWHRMAVTIDDLIFFGWSLWAVKRGAARQVLDAERVPMGMWKFGDGGVVMVTDPNTGKLRPADDDEVVLIPGPSEGLLAYAGRSLGGARDVEEAWVERAKHPFMIDLHQTVEGNLDPTEAQEIVDAWASARESSGIALTPYDVQANDLGATVDSGLYIEGRNASRIDIANFFNLPAALLDGSLSTASLTYSTQEGRRNDVVDYTLPYWTRPLEGRLSQDDVVPAGQHVRFDLASLIDLPQSPTGGEGNE
jgi:hypothetical protein